jgi:Fungal specific transcription factor domain
LHNRILSLEASVQVLVQSGVRRAPTAEYERTVLATGPSGSSSVVVSLEDVASIWLEQLDILKDVDLRVLPPDYSERTKMAFPDMHLFIDPLYPDEGPCVTFKLIHQLPNQSVRDVLLRHLEMTMLMHPSFNFPTFKRRVEALFDPILFSPASPPTESEKPHVGGAAALAKRPSLAFFAATVGGLALGARVASSSISHSSPTPQSERRESSPPGEASAHPYNADALFLLSTQALAVAEFNQNYDLDHISAVLLNGLFLLHDGKQRVAHTIYPTIGKLVNIAKMMGLHIDPDEFPGKYTLYDAECRRRSWWDVYYYDLCVFISPQYHSPGCSWSCDPDSCQIVWVKIH